MRRINILTIILFSLVIYACTNQPKVRNNNTSEPGVETPSLITFSIVDTIKHDTSAYTQGLIVYKGDLLESTGLVRRTLIRKIDTLNGQTKTLYAKYNQDIFGEGITLLGEELFQLTYRNNLVYVFDVKDFSKPVKTFNWEREGWGCTTDSTSIIISDGSSSLFFVDPNTFKIEREIKVNDNLGEVDNLNELEYINGYIYANRWHSNKIYKISPENGDVVGLMHFDGIIQMYDPEFMDNGENVLNGLAWDRKNETLFITGKNWPIIFKVKLN